MSSHGNVALSAAVSKVALSYAAVSKAASLAAVSKAASSAAESEAAPFNTAARGAKRKALGGPVFGGPDVPIGLVMERINMTGEDDMKSSDTCHITYRGISKPHYWWLHK